MDTIYGEDEDVDICLGRYVDKLFYGQSWKSLEHEVNEFIGNVKTSLSAVIKHNRDLFNSQPNCYDITVLVD